MTTGKRSLLTTVVLVALSIVGCEPASPRGRPTVVTSVLPQAFFVERLAGPLVEVEVMIPPGANPATYNPSMEQMKAVSRAAVYFKVGHEAFPFERAWLDRLLAVGARIEIVDGSEGSPCAADDPHVWVSPASARVMAGNLAATLEKILPEHRELLRKNLDSLEREIDELDLELRQTLGPFAGREFLVFHPSWGCLASAYGLEQVSIEHHGKEPTSSDLAELIGASRAAGIRVVFVQPQFARAGAETIAREIGATVVPLDPLARDWSDNLRRVAHALRDSFGSANQP